MYCECYDVYFKEKTCVFKDGTERLKKIDVH